MSPEAKEARCVVESFAECWNRHDMNAFAELFSEDAEFVNVVGLWWKGRAEIKAAHEFTHQTIFKNSRLTIAEVFIRFPAPQIAITRCHWKLEGHVTPDGAPLPERNGILLNILRRESGRWFIIDSQNTDIIEGGRVQTAVVANVIQRSHTNDFKGGYYSASILFIVFLKSNR